MTTAAVAIVGLIHASELENIVQSAVARALAEHDGRPTLLDRTALARALSCSPSTVDNMRKKGMPTLFIGEAPRFELAAVLHWVKNGDQN